MDTLIRHAHLVSPDYDCPDGFLLVRDGRIARMGPEPPRAEDAQDATTLDAHGTLVLPGFFDIHFHGRSNADFCDATPEALDTIGHGKLADGVTHVLATTMTVSRDCLRQVARACADYRRADRSDRALLHGLHLEGPFFNPACVGAQNPEFLLDFDLGLVDELNAVCPVRKVSFSPELPGALAFTRALVERGIMPSAGHSEADYDGFQTVHEAGLRHLTHFCNVMTPLHHLRLGMVGGGLLADDTYVEIICDGVHLQDGMIRIIERLKTPRRLMLITDSMRAAGMPDGDYTLGGQKVLVRNRRATLENGVVAGGVGLMHECLRRLARTTRRPLPELVCATGLNQAESLGLEGIGRLSPGWEANLVMLDPELNPIRTLVRGQLAWRA